LEIIIEKNGDWGLGIGDLGIGDWGLGPIPNPQSPIPNPQSPFFSIKLIPDNNNNYHKKLININYFLFNEFFCP
jgi:hypothetical protein